AELDSARTRAAQAEQALKATTNDLEAARLQLEDGQRELRALRNEEAKAARLEEGLRTARDEFVKLDREHADALEAKEREMEAQTEAIRIELQAELDQIAEQMSAEQRSQLESAQLDNEAVKNQLNDELA